MNKNFLKCLLMFGYRRINIDNSIGYAKPLGFGCFVYYLNKNKFCFLFFCPSGKLLSWNSKIIDFSEIKNHNLEETSKYISCLEYEIGRLDLGYESQKNFAFLTTEQQTEEILEKAGII